MFSVGGLATWNLEYVQDDFELQGIIVEESFDAVGFGNYFRQPGTIPEWRGNAYVNVNAYGLNARYTFNYIDGVFDERCLPEGACDEDTFAVNSGSYTRQDLTLTYDLTLGGADLRLQGSVFNIFDEAPPIARLPISYNPFLADAIGRHYQLGAKVRF